ncbi:MAG: DUF3991 and toprim domain-containing protein [Oscillospiraceae bacterium]
MPYIPFTEEQKIAANSVDLADFLRLRGEKLESAGREHKLVYYDGSGKHDSITINGSRWFDHKNQVGGGAVRFMRYFYGMDFQTAVQELLGRTVTPLSHSPPKAAVREEKPKEFKLPEANGNMHRVFAYLIKQRFIAPDIISYFAKRHTLYEDKEHHNAVFVGIDENGVPRQASKRSTNSFGKTFRITCGGSDTRYSFAHFGESEKLFAFEAPIDMMSFLTLYPQDWQKHSYIAMNGVYENAVITALETHKHISEIIICTDNDEGGIDAAERLTDILKEKGYTDISRKLPEFKDWNECLKAENGVEALAAVPHRRKEIYYETLSELRYFRCSPDRIIDRLSKTLRNGQYRYLAEYALAASAFFIGGKNENAMFDRLKSKLFNEYRAYSDKGKMTSKQDDLRNAYKAVTRDLRYNQSRTKEEIIQTSKLLFQLADCAVRCETEQEMSAPVISQEEAQEEISEAISFGFG